MKPDLNRIDQPIFRKTKQDKVLPFTRGYIKGEHEKSSI